MKLLKVFLIFILFMAIAPLAVLAQNSASNADQIRKQMAKIRQSADWGDADAAQKAKEQIRALSIKMMDGPAPAKAFADSKEKSPGEGKMELWDQMMISVGNGEEADILMGEPVRKEIVEEYREDEVTMVNPKMAEESKILVLDLSVPWIRVLIDQMKSFKSVETLVITGGVNGATVNLPDILERAKDYPLTELYIICFQSFVTTIPEDISRFRNLKTLGLLKNHLTSLPFSTRNFSLLKKLYIDYNPLKSIATTISSLKNLEVLGIIKTGISDAEVSVLKKILPNCKIQTE